MRLQDAQDILLDMLSAELKSHGISDKTEALCVAIRELGKEK